MCVILKVVTGSRVSSSSDTNQRRSVFLTVSVLLAWKDLLFFLTDFALKQNIFNIGHGAHRRRCTETGKVDNVSLGNLSLNLANFVPVSWLYIEVNMSNVSQGKEQT